jgi:hypothetical protein
MRRGLAQETTTEPRVADDATGTVIFDSAAGTDDGPGCQCPGPYCEHPSACGQN